MPNDAGSRSVLTRLFTPTGVAVGTLLGSLIAAVVMIWLNYRVLGFRSLGNRLAVTGVVAYLIILLATTLLPSHPAIAVAVIAGQCAIAWWATRTLQGGAIEYHRAHGGALHGNGTAALVGLATGLVAAVLLLLAARMFGLPIGIQ